MNWSDLPLTPPPRTLRQFAGLCLAFFGTLAAWHGLMRDQTSLALALALLAVGLGTVGLVKPQAMRPVYVAWMLAVFPIGWLVSRLILVLLYYGLITPVGLLFRLAGRDLLRLQPRPDTPTYWVPKPEPAGAHSYFRQF